jgi:D-amino-acid oxidase
VPGVVMRPTRMLLRAEPPAAQWWTAAVPDLRRLEADEIRAPYTAGLAFTAPSVEMPRYLP